jgi:hypothetical protein
MPDNASCPLRSAREDSPSRVVAFPRARASEPLTILPLELSSFIGREREVVELRGLVGKTRLLTLTGPGGCGKTRLALAVAFEAAGSFENGARWAGLAPLSDPDLVPQAPQSGPTPRLASSSSTC